MPIKKINIKNFESRIERECNSKRYAVVWLFYPNPIETNDKLKNGYIFGSILNVQTLKLDDFFKNNVEFVVITPQDIDDKINLWISDNFDKHILYEESIHMNFITQSKKIWSTENPEHLRWEYVLNKLYVLHPDLFGDYEKVLFLDSDIMIKSPHEYAKLFNYSTPAGVYENSCRVLNQKKNQLVHRKFKDDELIHSKFCTAGTLYYHCINAGLLLLKANEKDYERIKTDNQHFTIKYPQFAKHNLYFPEQEYLTNFYAGKWHSINHNFLTTVDTPNHHAKKFWNEFDFLHSD